jgi:hypothetical protein
MGLDNEAVFLDETGWHLAPDDAFPAEVEALVEGGGCHFRGKLYVYSVLELTDVNLAQELIEPATVAAMARRLREAFGSGELAIALGDEMRFRDMDPDRQASALVVFFETCAARGYGLVGSW